MPRVKCELHARMHTDLEPQQPHQGVLEAQSWMSARFANAVSFARGLAVCLFDFLSADVQPISWCCSSE